MKTLNMLCCGLLLCAGVLALEYTGVNLAGAEFGDTSLPGTYGTHYIYPNQDEVDYFKSRGMNIVRLCFRWERLQQSLYADLDTTELTRLHSFVTATTGKGVHVILDPHNFARYYDDPIGSESVPISAFSNFWSQVADLYRTNDLVIFGLMTEPHDMATETWRDAAQSAIDAIRATGAGNLILVPGNGWSGAHSWLHSWYGTPNGTAMLSITDPATNFAFDVHQYLDSDSSGTSDFIVNAEIGATRLMAFTTWCRDNDRRAFLSEFAVANSTIGSGIGDEAISNMLSYVESNSDVWTGWTWWAAGPWWSEYLFTAEPTVNYTVDRPCMGVLRNYLTIPAPRLEIVDHTEIHFDTWPGFNFQPETCPDLDSADWMDFGSVISGSTSPAAVTISPSNTASFYRINARPAP